MAVAAYLSTADVDAVIGADTRQALCSDTDSTTGYSSTYFDRLNNLASATVRAVARNSGFDLSSSSSDDIVKRAAVGQFILLAYGRKGLTVPEEWKALTSAIEDIRLGNTPIDSDPTESGAVGGFTWSNQDRNNASQGLAAVFARDRLKGY